MAQREVYATIIDVADKMPDKVGQDGYLYKWDNNLKKYVNSGQRMTALDDPSAVKVFRLAESGSTVPTAPKGVGGSTDGFSSLVELKDAVLGTGATDWKDDPQSVSKEYPVQWCAVYGYRNVPVSKVGQTEVLFEERFTLTSVILYSTFGAFFTTDGTSITIHNPDGSTVTQAIATPDMVKELQRGIEGIKKQVDGLKESYSGSGAPTLDISKYPMNMWFQEFGDKLPTDPEVITNIYQAHLDDTYLDSDGLISYRFIQKAGASAGAIASYTWEVIGDNALSKAIADLHKVAGESVRIFAVQPTPPYKVGDLWIYDSTKGLCRTCVKSKAGGEAFSDADWLDPYATSVEVNVIRQDLAQAKTDLRTAKGNINDLGNAMTDFTGELGKALRGNIDITAYKQTLPDLQKQLDREQAELTASVNRVIASPYLTDSKLKGALTQSRDEVLGAGGKLDQLQKMVAKSIEDGKLTTDEVESIQKLQESYNTAYKLLKERFEACEEHITKQVPEELNKEIEDAKKRADNARADAEKAQKRADDTYTKARTDGIITETERKAVDVATKQAELAKKYAEAQDELLKATMEKYADGKVTELETAQQAVLEAKATAIKTELEAYTDGVVSAEEQARIADVQAKVKEAEDRVKQIIEENTKALEAKAKEAKDSAEKAQRRADDTYTKAQADGIITETEQKAIDVANKQAQLAKEYAEAQDKLLKSAIESYADGKVTVLETAQREALEAEANRLKEEIKAYADGKVTEEESKRVAELKRIEDEAKKRAEELMKAIADAKNRADKANEALKSTITKAEADGKITEAEQRAIDKARGQAEMGNIDLDQARITAEYRALTAQLTARGDRAEEQRALESAWTTYSTALSEYRAALQTVIADSRWTDTATTKQQSYKSALAGLGRAIVAGNKAKDGENANFAFNLITGGNVPKVRSEGANFLYFAHTFRSSKVLEIGNEYTLVVDLKFVKKNGDSWMSVFVGGSGGASDIVKKEVDGVVVFKVKPTYSSGKTIEIVNGPYFRDNPIESRGDGSHVEVRWIALYEGWQTNPPRTWVPSMEEMKGRDALSASIQVQGELAVKGIAVKDGKLLLNPEFVQEVRGGINGYVQCTLIIDKGGRDVTTNAIAKGANPIWYVHNGNDKKQIQTGGQVLNVGKEYADGANDYISCTFDDARAEEW